MQDFGKDILDSLSEAPRFNRWMADTVSPYIRGKVLEIGAGTGNLTEFLSLGRDYVASDIRTDCVDTLQERFPSICVRQIDVQCAQDFDGLTGAFDTIVCLNVLEHVERRIPALANMRSALSIGGRAILLVPQGMWLYGSYDRVLGHHLRYNKRRLDGECKQAGFEVDALFSFNRAGVPAWFLNAILLRKKRFPQAQVGLLNTLTPFFARVDRFLPWSGLSLVCVARKAFV